MIGWLMTVAGLAVIALALGLLPVEQSQFGAPRWIMGMAGGIFVMAGLMMVWGEGSSWNNLLAALLLTMMGLVGGWVGFFGTDEGFSGGFPFLPDAVNISIGRGLFGIGALTCFLMAAYAFRLQFEHQNGDKHGSKDQI
ncbi:MAG: hypothetical protein R3222_04030 [Balneolaceae bacterium]|nr:hypothetical protein [Balneolaceae bacterium]